MSNEKKRELFMLFAVLMAYLVLILWLFNNRIIRADEAFFIGISTTIFIEVWIYVVADL